MVASSVASLDEVPPYLQEHYEERNGRFYLRLITNGDQPQRYIDTIVRNELGSALSGGITGEMAVFWHAANVRQLERGLAIDDADASVLADLAVRFRGAHDLALMIVTSNLYDGVPLPTPLQRFAAGVLRGVYKRPPKAKKVKTERVWLRDELILRCMRILVDNFGIRPTRNTASSTTCASDIVSAAFSNAGHKMVTPDAVVAIWKDKAFRAELNRVREFEEARKRKARDQQDYP